MTKKNPHWGTKLNEFLDAEGIREAAKTAAVTRVLARQLTQEMEPSEHQQGDAGRKDADQPRAGGPHPEGQRQHYDRHPATRRRAGRPRAAAGAGLKEGRGCR
jgi:hypothetical protein